MSVYTLEVNGKITLKTPDRTKAEEAVAALSISKDQASEIIAGCGYANTPEGFVQLSEDDGQWDDEGNFGEPKS